MEILRESFPVFTLVLITLLSVASSSRAKKRRVQCKIIVKLCTKNKLVWNMEFLNIGAWSSSQSGCTFWRKGKDACQEERENCSCCTWMLFYVSPFFRALFWKFSSRELDYESGTNFLEPSISKLDSDETVDLSGILLKLRILCFFQNFLLDWLKTRHFKLLL